MNKFIIGFMFVILTSRMFSESFHLVPKFVDLLDFAVIPLLLLLAFSRGTPKSVDSRLHNKISNLTSAFVVICILSALINYQRTFFGPITLYVFGMLEGPFLF